jgi:hypothetical protein
VNVEEFKAMLERETGRDFFSARNNPARGEHAYGIATDWLIADELEQRA